MNNAVTSVQAISLKLEDHERQRCEVWTRVMGYHRPVSSFNIGKQGEFHERKFFRETRARETGRL
ncbi:MAG: anaerobic ribonucleoside-triphosphate reductase [Acidiferrobacteraceae bacterium]